MGVTGICSGDGGACGTRSLTKLAPTAQCRIRTLRIVHRHNRAASVRKHDLFPFHHMPDLHLHPCRQYPVDPRLIPTAHRLEHLRHRRIQIQRHLLLGGMAIKVRLDHVPRIRNLVAQFTHRQPVLTCQPQVIDQPSPRQPLGFRHHCHHAPHFTPLESVCQKLINTPKMMRTLRTNVIPTGCRRNTDSPFWPKIL